jgi:hypothetical protein
VDIVVEGETTKHSFEKIIITVTNEIQGYNSADTALKEVVTYTIWDQFIEVQVDTEAVQDVEISRYYGLQTQNAVWNDTVTYVYMDGSEETYDMVNNSFARIKGENVVDYYVVADKSGRYLKVDLYNQGLGDFQAISNDQYTAFTMHYPKTYYNIINGEPVILNVGDSFTIQGIYEFGFKK